jgi:hypothetical protein
MKKRILKTTVFLALIAGLTVMTFAAQITLKNGKILEGPIVSYNAVSVTIKDATLGEITIARENILKIDPPLEEKRPAAAAPTYVYNEQRERPRAKSGRLQLGFNLSGGMSNIDGGDFNKAIRDYNSYYNDLNEYYGETNYTVDWKEMKWLTSFRGEIFARIGKYFGVGLGVEFMKKSNPGTIAYKYDDAYKYQYTDYYNNYSISDNQTALWDQSISVIPLTLNLYGFFPLGDKIDLFANLGPGYYLGTAETTQTVDETWIEKNTFYYNNGTPWPPHYYDRQIYNYTYQSKVTCNTIGFHFGVGLNYKLTSLITLTGEAFYRAAKFDNWEGTGSYNDTLKEDWGWVNNPDGPGTSSATTRSDDSWSGKLLYFENYDSDLKTKYYGRYFLYEPGTEPETDAYTKNIRPAAFNINGFSFRIGIKVGFDLL